MKYKIATGAVSMGLLLACGPVDVGLGGGSGGEAAREGVGGSYSGDTGGRNSTGGTDYDGLPDQFCGDGVIQYPEECDELPGRETTCAPDCRLRVDSGGVGGSSTGGTAGRGGSEQFCGDGVIQYPEECDEPPGRETTCAPDCRLRSGTGAGGSGGGASEGICGDGVLDRGENCDDGNRADRDGCSSDCQYLDGGTGGTAGRGGSDQFCGDGVVQYPEECDEPPGRETTCAPDCRLRVDSGGVGGSYTGGTGGRDGSEQYCGDGVVQYPEECDEPPGRETTCAPDCRLRSGTGAGGSGGGASEGICGDGVLDRGENCDDGNRADRDGCSSDCQYLDGGTGGTGTGVGGSSGRAGTDDVR